MCHDQEKFHAYARELLDAHASHEIEELITPYGEKATALKVSGRAHFTKLMRDFIISEGMVRIDDFKTMDQEDPATFGSLAHLHGIFDQEQERRLQERRKADDERLEAIRIRAEDERRFTGPLKIDPELKKQLLAELRQANSPRDPEEAARQAAVEVRRIMRGEE